MTKFAKRLKGMEKSAAIVRNIFNGMNDPEIISFGGGAPAKEGLPVDILRKIADEVIRIESRGMEALQYGGVMGIIDLREFIARELLATKRINDEIMKHLFDVKTATNSHTSTLCQVLASEFFNRGYFPDHLKNLCDIHRKRRDVMMACLDKHFPEGTEHTYPDGGLFTWVDLPNKIDATKMLEEAERDYKVSYLAGESFFTKGGGKGRNSMRISFGNVTTQKIKAGTEKLGALAQLKIKQFNG